jgi:protein-S-isoprenylcysteine O-methyltransferase Ste14
LVGVAILLVALFVYAFRHKDEILAEAFPDQYGKKHRKRISAANGSKKRS